MIPVTAFAVLLTVSTTSFLPAAGDAVARALRTAVIIAAERAGVGDRFRDPAQPVLEDTTSPPAGEADALRSDTLYLRFDQAEIAGSLVDASGVDFRYGEYHLTGGRLNGDLDGELIFTGSPTLTYRSQTLRGDAIRFDTRLRSYRIENVRAALSPDFLRNRTVEPLYLSGGSITGREGAPVVGTGTTATSCSLSRPHYTVETGEIEVSPGERLVIRRAALSLMGRRIVVLPTVVVPLNRRFPEGGYRPYVGRSLEEGWFVKTGFNYRLAENAPGLYRVDLMERKGIGIGIEQAWNRPGVSGEAALYGIPSGGTGSNLTARLRSRLTFGGGATADLGYDLRRNDYRTMPDTTDDGYRATLTLGGRESPTILNVARRRNTSGDYHSSSSTANFSQRLGLGSDGSISLNADYSGYTSGSTGGQSQTNEQLATRLQADYRRPNYTLQLTANRNIPIGRASGQSYFGGVERLPEAVLSQYRPTSGFLARLPLTFMVGAGRFSEGIGGTGSKRTVTERAAAGFDLNPVRYTLSARTDLDVSGGFLQYLYGENAAQYVLRSQSSLTQRWGAKSGLALRHSYQQPHGGTPFRFDRQGKYHSITADVGFLDDARLQLTARVGYDLAGSDYGGQRLPWQTLSANLYVRPVDWFRLRNLVTYDPNQGELVSITSDLRIRGTREFAFDLISRYDPRTHRFGQINAYLNMQALPKWRVVALLQYNGYLNRFESRNLQIIHDMHCMEASLTYIDNPYGWRADRQIMVQIRIKAFPAFQQFGTGLYGQALDTSVAERF